MRGALVDLPCIILCDNNTSDMVDALTLDLPSLPTMLLFTLNATVRHTLLCISSNTSNIVDIPILHLPKVSSNIEFEIILWAKTVKAVFKKF